MLRLAKVVLWPGARRWTQSLFLMFPKKKRIIQKLKRRPMRAVFSLIESWGRFSKPLSSDSNCLLAKEAGMHVEEDAFA